jgi:hypothetical protein
MELNRSGKNARDFFSFFFFFASLRQRKTFFFRKAKSEKLINPRLLTLKKIQTDKKKVF